jgi:cyclopropane fatty-acyl-phospholipid synthase-like methyltransferase
VQLGFPYWETTLEETVRTGDPSQTLADWLADSDALERAQQGFRALDTLLVEDVADAIPVRDSDRDLLAVGGGHAPYAIEVCRRYPHLDATIVDDPDALALARQDVAATDLDDRIDCAGLDVRSAYLGESYDLAFLVDRAHGVGPVVDSELLARIYDALEPGGRVSVLGQFGDERPTPASNAAVAVARFLAFSTGGDTHATDTVADWLRDAGFDSVDETKFRALPDVGLVVAEKPKTPSQ